MSSPHICNATQYHKWCGTFSFFLQTVVSICVIWKILYKSCSTISSASEDLCFVTENHFHPVIHSLCLSLFSPLQPCFLLFFFVLVAICFSAYKSPFIQPISYCSITGTNFCFYLFVLHLFYCGFSIFKRLGQNTTL